MKTTEIRNAFLEYFLAQGHEIVPSSPLVPANDPTLLFTNAGMVQFKEVFLGREQRNYARAASSQRCVRAGGKHNDLDNVGYTARHHTFFEMLGNFSFGDYFKREAIAYAWRFLTGTLAIPAEKLWVTVYQEDDEAAAIWLDEIGVDPARFSRCGEQDNFWTMGPTGPCGPCTEIFYDHGPEIAGGPPGSPEQEGDRYIEIWNLVFTQYDRDEAGNLNPIPRPSVDTGMGLERIAAVLQGVHNNYDIDLFQDLIAAVRELAGGGDPDRKSLQVIADHIRSCAFIVMDGVLPSNEGRGYVLRRIIRRAIRHGHKIGISEVFFHRLVAALERAMGDAYPELGRSRVRIEAVLRREEERFNETLDQGLRLLDGVIAGMQGTEIPGEEVFRLYDTYGFPVDLTADIARERGLTLNMAGFETAMEGQRERARAASQFSGEEGASSLPNDVMLAGDFRFDGYERLSESATVRGIYVDGTEVEGLSPGQAAVIVLDHTPFYAESGGQVGDRGRLKGTDGLFEVSDTRKQGGVWCHIGTLKLGSMAQGAMVEAEVNPVLRQDTVLNHSATHLLHAALRRILGEHVQQKGSLVAPDRLRFDFSHPQPLSPEERDRIEAMVNEQIRANLEIETRVMSMQQAMDSGAMALFGEKYGDEVRVLGMGDFSMELCGGTHARRSGDIGLFRIISETGVASGVRRIEALSGAAAMDWSQQQARLLEEIAARLKTTPPHLTDKLVQLQEKAHQQDKEIQALKGRIASQSGGDLSAQAVDIAGVRVLAREIEGMDAKGMRELADQLKNKLGSAALVLATVADGKVRLLAGVSADLTDRIQAGDLVNFVATQVGGKGGGRADMAQAGGSRPEALADALTSVPGWIEERLSH